jgi:hypothetical protein
VSCRQGSNAVCGYCTTRFENTHGTEFQELLYRWHPWFGLRIGVHEAIKRSGEVVFRCSLSGADVDRWLEIPAWMFERSACAKVRVAAHAHPDLSALRALAELVRDALSNRFAPSNALLSGASNLSRDQNRGEVYATPDEADASAPLFAATNRPVRTRTKDHDQRYASVVWPSDGDTSRANRPDDAVDLGSCRLDDGGRS